MPHKVQSLTSQEAKKLLVTYGRNTLPEGKKQTKLSHFLSQFTSPLIYILILAGIITFILKDYKDSLVIFVAVFVNTILGYYQEVKAEKALDALKSMLMPKAKVMRDTSAQYIDAANIVPGDIVVLGQGDKIPADGILVEGVSFSANEAILTGESTSVVKKKNDEIYMGTHVSSGRGLLHVQKTGAHTKMGSIADQISAIDNTETPLQKRLAQLARTLAMIVLGLSVVVLVVGLATGTPFTEIFSTSVALAVASIPEGMAVSLTVILAIGMQRILKKKALVRRLVAAETLGSVSVIATDKTGTLTEGQMKVVHSAVEDKKTALHVAVYANNLEDPLEIALWEWAQENKLDPQALTDSVEREDEKPFDSDTKYMYVTTGDTQYIKGAPEIVLEMCSLSLKKKEALTDEIQQWSQKGLRLVGLATKKRKNKKCTWIGLVAMEDPVRKNIHTVMETCKQAGIRPVMITGDYAGTARAVWTKVNKISGELHILDGQQIEKLSDEELKEKVKETDIYARVSPVQKLRIVDALRENGDVVALVGDGVNDAPALKKANIGIVVGSASDVAKETADMVLLDSNFKTIVSAIEEGRGIYSNMRKVILYLLSDAFAEIILVLGSMMLGLPIPLTAAQILWINVITDGLPAIALTVEPKSPNLLKRKPINPKIPLVDFEMKSLIAIVSGVTGLFSLVIFVYYFNTAGLAIARTVTFAALAFGTLVYIFSVRSLSRPLLEVGLRKNTFLFFAVGVGLLLQLAAVYEPYTRAFLQNQSMTLAHWYVVGLFTIGIMITIEATKFLFSRTQR